MVNPHPKTPKFEYNQITRYIYLGTNQCCKIHFEEELQAKGIKADISLEDNKIDQPFGVEYYLWLPTKDHEPPTQKKLLCGAYFIKNLIDKKVPVYIHCQNGHKRSPTLVVAYMILMGKTPKQAIKLIKSKRPSIHMEQKHMDALTKFQQSLR